MRGNLKLGNTRGKEERPSLFIVRSSQLSDQFLRFQHMVLKFNFRRMKVCFPKIFKDFFWGLGGIGMLVAGGRLGSLQILGELPIGLQQVRHWGVKRLVSVRANQSKYY